MVDDKERGIDALKASGLVDETIPVYPGISSWPEAMELLDYLRVGDHDHKALAIDAMGGFERLCHEEVCRRDYNGNWAKDGFTSYQAGYEVSLSDWRQLLAACDRLRDERNMTIVMLGHAKIAPFKNPAGPDYDRYAIDVHHKTWSVTHKWADMVLFANYEVAFYSGEQHKQKAKAKGGQQRVMYTEHEAAFDAKNRHNLPPEIDMGKSAVEAFANFKAAILKGKQQTTVKEND